MQIWFYLHILVNILFVFANIFKLWEIFFIICSKKMITTFFNNLISCSHTGINNNDILLNFLIDFQYSISVTVQRFSCTNYYISRIIKIKCYNCFKIQHNSRESLGCELIIVNLWERVFIKCLNIFIKSPSRVNIYRNVIVSHEVFFFATLKWKLIGCGNALS